MQVKAGVIQAMAVSSARAAPLLALVEAVLFLPIRVQRRLRSWRRYRVRSEAIEGMRRALEGFTDLKADGHRALFNVALYLLLLDQDLADFTDDLVCSTSERRRVFAAKQEAVLLYEAAEDLPQLLGKAFRDAIKVLGLSEEQQRRLDVASSDLNKFWQKEREFLGGIRNAVAAHREHDALGYLEALESVKPLEVMARGADLSERLESLVSVIGDIAGAASGPRAILGDMVAHEKNRAG